MRISTATLHRQGVENMLRQQAQLAKTQNQIATGNRIQTAASDPSGWSRAAGLDQAMAALENYQSNAAIAAERLGYEDTALADASDILATARELAIQANSAAMDSSARSIIVTQLQALQQRLLDAANTQDGEGRYLFAGTDSGTAPFSLSNTGVATYSGDQQARLMQLSAHRSISDGDNGFDVFQNLASGNGTFAVAADGNNAGSAILSRTAVTNSGAWDGGSYTLSFNGGNYQVLDSGSNVVASGAYTSGAAIAFRGIELTLTGTPGDGDQLTVGPSANQDVFATLQKLITFAQAPSTSPAQRAQNQTLYFGALQELDAAQTHFSDLRGGIGARLNSIEDAQTSLSAQSVLASQHLMELRDLDYAEATSRLALQQTLLQAAQLSYQRVQGLSLFDYLR